MVTDTHCHLDMITNDIRQQESLLEQCQKEQIGPIINVSVDVQGNFNSENLSKTHEAVFFAAGIHPHEALKTHPDDIPRLEPLIRCEKCVAIGEVGIDLHYRQGSIKEQTELFERFLCLAKQHGKPVIIHSRQSFQEVMALLKKPEHRGVKGVFHCFSYSYEEARQCLDLGYKVSFAGNVTYKNAHDIQDAARKIPVREIFLETDAPFLAPEPERGKKNLPTYILHTARFLSGLRHEPFEEMTERIEENVRNFFPALQKYALSHRV